MYLWVVCIIEIRKIITKRICGVGEIEIRLLSSYQAATAVTKTSLFSLGPRPCLWILSGEKKRFLLWTPETQTS